MRPLWRLFGASLTVLALVACAPDYPTEVSTVPSVPPAASSIFEDRTVDSTAVAAAQADDLRRHAEQVWWTAIATAPKPKPVSVAPHPRGTTNAAPHGGSCGGWADTVAALWPASQVAKACSILYCESQGNPNAHNRSGASGLFQLMPIHAWRFEAHGWTWADVDDGWKNAVVAHDLWSSSGWGPWVCA